MLTLFVLVDFLSHVDRRSMELPILYFKGSKILNNDVPHNLAESV